jgi:hypothetical protein
MTSPNGRRRQVTCMFSLFMAVVAMDSSGAQAPKLTSFQPSKGTERSLVLIEGEGLDTGVVVWDAGLPSEKKIARVGARRNDDLDTAAKPIRNASDRDRVAGWKVCGIEVRR